jgi:FixJ family two-component response regulator
MILKKATILIVDDDPDVLTAVKLLLKPRPAGNHHRKEPRKPELAAATPRG